MRRRKCCRLRVGCNSLDNAANLLGMTRTAQGSPGRAGDRITSGGVLLSFPGQNGQVSTKAGTGCTARCVANSSGRLARSVAIMTHSLVKKFWRSSGIRVPPVSSIGNRRTFCSDSSSGRVSLACYKIPTILMDRKIPIGILGATGVVGQRFIQMLERHPWFEVAWLAASDRSEGKVYAEAARWRLKTPIPTAVAKMPVSPATPEGAPKVIFAALDAAIAAELEPRFAEAGCAVVSNSSALRMKEDVPLVIPEVNAGHIRLIDAQASRLPSPRCTGVLASKRSWPSPCRR